MTTWLRSLLVSCLLAAGVAAVVPTPAGAITGPPQVTALTITATTTTSISLSWQNPADPSITGIVIRRAVGSAAPLLPTDGTAVATLDAAATSYIDPGLTPQTTYSYSVFTHDAAPVYSLGTRVSQATASFTWNAVAADPYRGGPLDISCPTTTFCMAVDGSGQAVRYHNGVWDKPVLLHASQGQFAGLSAVACPNSTFCMAVDGAGGAYRYNGITWSLAGTGTHVDSVTDVACVSATFCLAVGGRYATRFTGSTWTAPRAFGNSTTGLARVSCASTMLCVIVGISTTRHTNYAWRWNGTAWDRGTAVIPEVSSQIWDVSCVKPGFCMATADNGYAFGFDGRSWHRSDIAPSSGFDAHSVSCTSATFCVAVSTGFPGQDGAATRWNGRSWSAPVTVEWGDLGSAVSCASTTCTMVNAFGATRRYYRGVWGSTQWFDATQGSLRSVSCVSPSMCVALDGWGNFIRYNGINWSAPSHVANRIVSLSDVSCPTTTFCVTVDGRGVPWVYNGSTWSARAATTLPNPTHVSCARSNYCIVLGGQRQAVLFDGVSWHRPATYAPDPSVVPRGISCTSIRFCAVIAYTSTAGTASPPTLLVTLYQGRWHRPIGLSKKTAAANWIGCAAPTTCLIPMEDGPPVVFSNGTIRRLATVANPWLLSGTACVTPTFCAVGGADGNVQTFNGSTLDTITSMAGLPDPQPSVLDLSCVAPAFCAAVGWFGASTGS